MNLGSVYGNLTVKERKFILKVMHVYVWDDSPISHATIRIIIRNEYNKIPFLNLLTVIKAVKLYRANTTMSYDDMEMLEVLLKKLKGLE